jgi:hypothetical protein
VQQAAHELYGLPLEDFTKARDEQARRLRKDGRRGEAEAVKALRKPTVPAWALNQLARRRPDDIRQLLATGARMREGQAALLAGGDRSSLQRASAEERRLVAELTRAATEILGEEAGKAGGKAAETAGERIRSTLHAAALDGQTAAELEAGRLVREQEAVGLFGAAPAAAKPTTSSPTTVSPTTVSPTTVRQRRPDRTGRREDTERRRALEQELRAAREEEQRARREHAGALKATERADKRAKDTQRRVDEARAGAEQARAGLREAERRERNAATASDRAARAVRSAEKKLG